MSAWFVLANIRLPSSVSSAPSAERVRERIVVIDIIDIFPDTTLVLYYCRRSVSWSGLHPPLPPKK